MRILSWNVNGIKTLPYYHPWNALKEYEAIIDALEADIICIQETKIARKGMDKSLAVMDNFDGFFSFLRPPGGRHGTAIFTRRSAVVPVKAEEGLSSVLIPSSTPNEQRIGGYPLLSDHDISFDELIKLESEGRATVIDCGLFVLINLYSPNLTNDERLKFKNDFNLLIDKRVRNFIRLGRQVIVVGDLNICLTPDDTAEPQNLSKDGDVGNFDQPEYRRWLQDFVGPSGPMIDIVRQLHPDRKKMYTCWDTKTEARKTNYGGRIDYVLITPGLRPWVKHADIQPEIVGSDHCPVYVDFHDEIEIEGRGTVKLWDEMNPTRRGMDKDMGKLPDPPPFATRYYPEFSSKQKSIMGYFSKGFVPAAPAPAPSPSPTPTPAQNGSRDRSASASSSTATNKSLGKRKASPSPPPRLPTPPPPGSQQKLSGFFKPPPKAEKTARATTKKGSRSTKAASKATAPAPTLASTSTPPTSSNVIDITSSDDDEIEEASISASARSASRPDSEPPVFDPQDLEAAYEAASSTTSQWNSIFAPKAAPLCDVHQEPARLWTVNKPGLNKGRRFYLCARPVGTGYDNGSRPKSSVNNEYRCDFFKWDTQVKRPAGIALDRSGKKAKN